jgi:hypothetical protein
VFKALKFDNHQLVEEVFKILKAYPQLYPQLTSAERFLAFTINTTSSAVNMTFMNEQIGAMQV